MSQAIGHDKLRALLTQLQGSPSEPNQRQDAITKLCAIGSTRLLPALQAFLNASDCELRCLAAEAIFHVDPQVAVPLLRPHLDDPEVVVRWHICGLLHDIRDRRAVGPLIERMKTDPDPQVRNTAAYALGGIGDPSAIPDLIETLDDDHEVDELGHTASWCAAMALDEIIGRRHARVKDSNGLCQMSSIKPDLVLLKAEAMKYYDEQQS